MADASGPVLVLGGSGLVGGAVVREAIARGTDAVGTYRLSPMPGLQAWDGDPSSLGGLFERVDPHAVFYAAGFTNVDACETREDEAFHWNAVVPAAAAAASRDRAFVYFSTEYVFDGLSGPYSEDAAIRALSAYARSKVAGEERVLAAHPGALVIRTTVVYGHDPQGKSFVSQLRRRLGNRERMRVPADQVSTPTYSADLAARTLDLVARGAAGIWHVTGPARMDRFSFATLAAGAFGLDPALLDPAATKDLGQVAPRPLQAGLSTGKLVAALGPGAMRHPARGLAEYASRERLPVRQEGQISV